MKALFIEEMALRTIVAKREFQSGEYDKALEIVNFIKNPTDTTINNLELKLSKEIGYIYSSKKINLNKAVVFDLSKLGAFLALDNDDVITVFQKILKCTLKSWEKLTFNNATERNIANNQIILFPFPYSNLNPFKVLLNTAPDTEYTSKRGMMYMYVANAGHGEFPMPYPIINIKAIRNEASKICTIDNGSAESSPDIVDALAVTELDEISTKKDHYIDYETWMHLLTQKQKAFVTKAFNGNERLEGAAGTGKTLTLVLRALFLYKKFQSENQDFHLIFIAHSLATKLQLISMFETHCQNTSTFDRAYSKQSITVTTLQEWCTEYLGSKIGRSEIMDLDAQETKDSQLMFLRELFTQCYTDDFPTYKSMCSHEFIEFIDNTDLDIILELIQSEISVSIKGRAGEDFEIYKSLPRLECSMPISSNGDYSFIFLIFEKYQKLLLEFGYFDNDDISLSAQGQLNTPIWRRRRKEDGFDAIFVDETHLFSYNELSIFHYLSKDDGAPRIIYAIDKTQAIGDKGLNKKTLEASLKIETNNSDDTKYKTVFRSSPQIVNLAFSVLTSGVNLFINFENPLEKVNFSFINSEENKASTPEYLLLASDEEIIESCFSCAEKLADELSCSRNNILIVCTTMELLDLLEKKARNLHKPFEVLKRRGDMEVVRSAEKNKRYVIGYIDYVGGLEFDGVIIAGVDKGRVPPVDKLERSTYQSYAWHNRMYVAITRAKYSAILIGNKSRTASPLLESAIRDHKLLLKEVNTDKL